MAHNIIAENEGVAVITPKLEIKFLNLRSIKLLAKLCDKICLYTLCDWNEPQRKL